MASVRLPSLEGLRAFEAAARLGSFERAAQELNVTSSAASKRVAAVEQLLGEILFVRGANTLTLTSGGREYHSEISQVLRTLSAMPMHTRGPRPAERLRVTAPPTFARQILAPHVHEFSRRHPAIDLEINLSVAVLDSAPMDADVEVRNGDALQPGMKQLLHDVVVPMASPDLIRQLPAIETPADLAGVPLLRSPLESWLPWFQAAGLPWPEPASGPKFVDLGLMMDAAVAGQGVALLRPTLASSWMQLNRLKPLLPIVAAPANQYYLRPWTRKSSPELFSQWLLEVCERIEWEARGWVPAEISGSAR